MFPLLNSHLTGNANLQSGGGKQASITFTFTSPPVTKTFGNVAFTANHFSLTTLQGLWGVQADTAFTLHRRKLNLRRTQAHSVLLWHGRPRLSAQQFSGAGCSRSAAVPTLATRRWI